MKENQSKISPTLPPLRKYQLTSGFVKDKKMSKWKQRLLFLLATSSITFMTWLLWAYKGFPPKKPLPTQPPPADVPNDAPIF